MTSSQSPFAEMNIPFMGDFRNTVNSTVESFGRVADELSGLFNNNDNNDNNDNNNRARAPNRNQPATHPTNPFERFESFFGSGRNDTPGNQPAPATQVTPPASISAIRQLPTILVSPEDLVDENNRECVICLEQNSLRDRVTRLPCAHIFHCDCIQDWLKNHKCTCPVCRYELPTDDPVYERGREERMKTRTPRYARYELDRMPVKQLLALRRGKPTSVTEKKDLIQQLIDEERVDLIPVPEPVTYKLDDLKKMKVSNLKQAMNNAGVYFYGHDVVEKSDMIRVFRNSGRLLLIETPETKENSRDTPPTSSTNVAESRKRKSLLVETVDENDEGASPSEIVQTEETEPQVVMFPSAQGTPATDESSSTPTTEGSNSTPINMEATDEEREDNASSSDDYNIPTPLEAPSQHMEEGTRQLDSGNNGVQPMDIDESSEVQTGANGATHAGIQAQDFDGWSISQLRAVAADANIDLSGCHDRDSALNTILHETNCNRPYLQAYFRSLSPLARSSLSDLRSVARTWNVDIRGCLEKGDIFQLLIKKAKDFGNV